MLEILVSVAGALLSQLASISEVLTKAARQAGLYHNEHINQAKEQNVPREQSLRNLDISTVGEESGSKISDIWFNLYNYASRIRKRSRNLFPHSHIVSLRFRGPANTVDVRSPFKKGVEGCCGWWRGGNCSDDGSSNMVLIGHGGLTEIWAKSLDEELPNAMEIYVYW